jgi:hypothetical protein
MMHFGASKWRWAIRRSGVLTFDATMVFVHVPLEHLQMIHAAI